MWSQLIVLVVLVDLSLLISAQRRPPRDFGYQLPETRNFNATTGRPLSTSRPSYDPNRAILVTRDRTRDRYYDRVYDTDGDSEQQINNRDGDRDRSATDLERRRPPGQGAIIFPNNRSSLQNGQQDKKRKKDQNKKRNKNKLKGVHDRGHRVGWSATKVGEEDSL